MNNPPQAPNTTIYKYSVPLISKPTTLQLPGLFPRPLHVAMQPTPLEQDTHFTMPQHGPTPQIWVEVNPDSEHITEVQLAWVGTGHSLPLQGVDPLVNRPFSYLSTLHLPQSEGRSPELVFHLYCAVI